MMTRRTLVQSAAALGGLSLLPLPTMAATSARAAGYRYPEETDPHERTLMQWPVNRAIHDDADFLHDLQGSIAKIAHAIAEFEPVVMLAAASHHRAIRKRVSRAVELWDVPTDDLWCRDLGPFFVVNGKGGIAVTQFNFNGWGNQQIHGNDGQIAERVAQRLGLPVFNTGLVGEAGGVKTDGHGTLIAHESSFVNPNRNKGGKAEVERLLLDTMGAQKISWAPGVKGADITDYTLTRWRVSSSRGKSRSRWAKKSTGATRGRSPPSRPPTSWPPPPTRRGENCNWWCCPSRKSRASRRTISSRPTSITTSATAPSSRPSLTTKMPMKKPRKFCTRSTRAAKS